jgi:hypothetical protein
MIAILLFMCGYLLLISGSDKGLNRTKRTPLKEVFSTNVQQCSRRAITKPYIKKKRSAAPIESHGNENLIDKGPQTAVATTGNYKKL